MDILKISVPIIVNCRFQVVELNKLEYKEDTYEAFAKLRESVFEEKQLEGPCRD